MKINSTVTRVMAATVAAGAVVISAGFGGTASADSGYGGYIPAFPPTVTPPLVNQQPYYPYLNVRYNTPVLINGRWVYPYQGYVAPNYVAPVYPYVYQAQYVQAAVTASQFSFITVSANVPGMNRGDVIVKPRRARR